jgi:hypothetical protein
MSSIIYFLVCSQPILFFVVQNTGGIQYLPGGVSSGFNHVVRDVFPTRLLHLKGGNTALCLVYGPALHCTALPVWLHLYVSN